MANEREFEAYLDYLGLKTHFNVWKFNWSPRKAYKVDVGVFEKRNDKLYFSKLAKLYPHKAERAEFLISSFLNNRQNWIGYMFDDDARDLHFARIKKSSALIYTFNNDVENIVDFMEDKSLSFKELLQANGQRPKILKCKKEILGGVSEETLALFDKFFGFTRQVTVNPLWDEERLRYHKYSSLLLVDDINQIKKTLKKLVAQN